MAFMFLRTETTRLNHIVFIDLLDNYRRANNLELQSLVVKQSRSVTKEESKSEEASELSTTSINYFTYEADYPVDQDKESKTESIKHKTVVFYISRDQDEVREDTFNFLPVASDVITSYQEKYPDDKSTLLLPIHQCGTYLGVDKLPLQYLGLTLFGLTRENVVDYFKRDHSVLAEVNLASKEIIVHDSTSSFGSYFYLPGISAPGFTTQYLSHAKQFNTNLCGYYVHCYVLAYLKTGNASLLKDIMINSDLIESRDNYLQNWPSIVPQIFSAINGSAGKTTLTNVPLELACDEPEMRELEREDEWQLLGKNEPPSSPRQTL